MGNSLIPNLTSWYTASIFHNDEKSQLWLSDRSTSSESSLFYAERSREWRLAEAKMKIIKIRIRNREWSSFVWKADALKCVGAKLLTIIKLYNSNKEWRKMNGGRRGGVGSMQNREALICGWGWRVGLFGSPILIADPHKKSNEIWTNANLSWVFD